MKFELNSPYNSEEETNPFKKVKLGKEESQSVGREQGMQNSELALIVSVKVEAKFSYYMVVLKRNIAKRQGTFYLI